MVDHCSPRGAGALANGLRDYWKKKGHDVHVRVAVQAKSSEKSNHNETLFVVRSNLHNGCPPGVDPSSLLRPKLQQAAEWEGEMILSNNGNPLKAIGFLKAMDLMRLPGTRLVRTRSTTGDVFYVVPGGYVEPDTAAKIIKHPQVVAGEDVMWPGMSQTWRLLGLQAAE
jgi:hypothetical protein